VRANWASWSFLLYAGGIVIALALASLLGDLNGDYGKAAFVGWALLVFAVVQTVAFAARAAGRPLVAGLFALSATIAFVVFVGALFSWWGWLANTDQPFDGFHVGNLVLELVFIGTALFDLRLFRFPLHVLLATVGVWFFVTDLVSGGGDWSAVVTIVVGIFLLLVGVFADRTYGFWIQVVAGLTIGGGLLWFWHSSDTDWILVGLAALVYVVIAAVLARSSYAVLGAFGLFLTATHFILKWAAPVDTPFFSEDSNADRPWLRALLYAAYGVLLMLLGLWAARRRNDEPPAA
jgi:hypothetical protein